MTKPKFTPGPWRYGYNGSYGYHLIEVNMSDRYIVECEQGVYPEDGAQFLKVEANVRLMCAATDMYDALKETISFMDDVYPADIFTGESGDEGPVRVVKLRRKIEQALMLAERGR